MYPDYYRVKASEMFGIPYEEVTEGHRSYAKQSELFKAYGMRATGKSHFAFNNMVTQIASEPDRNIGTGLDGLKDYLDKLTKMRNEDGTEFNDYLNPEFKSGVDFSELERQEVASISIEAHRELIKRGAVSMIETAIDYSNGRDYTSIVRYRLEDGVTKVISTELIPPKLDS